MYNEFATSPSGLELLFVLLFWLLVMLALFGILRLIVQSAR
ncbi:hypothetical protein [Halopelagius longus]|nr:hypothetical protein [Halopelagius longus]